MIIDIIGDIHGYADKLVGLLHQLGYKHNGQHFVPPIGHRALFIGDLIDRGSQQLATLEIVLRSSPMASMRQVSRRMSDNFGLGPRARPWAPS